VAALEPDDPKEGIVAINIQELYDKALALSANVEDNFLELGRSLRQLQDRDPDLFQQVVTKGELGRRKAYYLVAVSRTFDKAPVPRSRLRKIGWTKLQLIAKHVTPHNLDDLLELAKSTNSKQLERQMRGEVAMKTARCLFMYFSLDDYAGIEKALMQYGAVPSGRGIQNKEKALLRMAGAVNQQSKGA
jgi:hypothetical protein